MLVIKAPYLNFIKHATTGLKDQDGECLNMMVFAG